jgi:STE24 endopeptidase
MGLFHQPDAVRYHRWQFRLSCLGFLLTVAYLWVFLSSGVALLIRDRLATATHFWWLQIALALIIMGLGLRILTALLSWVQGFWLPRRFGLLQQPFLSWAWDQLKGALIGGVLVLLATEIVYGLLRSTSLWWLWAGGIFFIGYTILATIVPIWIVPLFYRIVPLQDAQLRDRLLNLARQAGVPVVGVWVADQSRKSKTANAALTGLGRTRRILLFDTLVQHFTAEEVESVLAHEMGHHVHRDIWRGLIVQGLVTIAMLLVANWLLRVGSARLGLEGLADPAGLPLLSLILVGIGLVAMPLGNAFSRWMERRADDFALAMTRDPQAFVAAMDRLADLNLAERKPNRLKEFLFHSHPSIDRRIAHAESWTAKPVSPPRAGPDI